MKIDIIIEIPKGSSIKYEFEKGKIIVDRILYGAMTYPHNYGFIENTLDWDGDPLDVLIISNHSFIPGSVVPTRIIGAMKMIDDGETDTKLIGVVDVDPRYNHIEKINDLGNGILSEIKDFFENYKNLQKKKVTINGFEDVKFAEKELKETQNLFKKHHNLKKNDFITLMKKNHPEKYKK